jgi:hypothetical protein
VLDVGKAEGSADRDTVGLTVDAALTDAVDEGVGMGDADGVGREDLVAVAAGLDDGTAATECVDCAEVDAVLVDVESGVRVDVAVGVTIAVAVPDALAAGTGLDVAADVGTADVVDVGEGTTKVLVADEDGTKEDDRDLVTETVAIDVFVLDGLTDGDAFEGVHISMPV